MAIIFEIDEYANTVAARAAGPLCDDDIYDYLDRLVADSRFRPSMNELLDCTAVTRVNLSVSAMHGLPPASPFAAGSKRAIVMHPDARHLFGMFRIYQSVADDRPNELHVQYDDLQDALDWVGVRARAIRS